MYGFGTLHLANGIKLTGSFKSGFLMKKGKINYQGNETYEGELRNSEPNGYGIYTYKDGSKFEGNFKFGLKNGNGIFTHPDGFVDHEVWDNGSLVKTSSGIILINKF